MKKFDRVKAVVSLDAIAHNFEEMKKNIAEGTKIVAVIKADGYGHGAEAIARLIEDYEYIWGYATATPEEALQLRDAGIDKPILILGIVFEEYYKELIAHEVRMTVCEYEMAAALSEEAVRQGRQVHIHIGLDTGMSRIGFADVPESVETIKKIAALPNVEIEGMFTHFARADETDRSPAITQLNRYLAFAELLEKAGNLSGGQCQRLVIARALLRSDSAVYIFDEAASNIDVESEELIMNVIHELAKTKTVLLISHRLANVVQSDQIYFLKNGTICERGAHAELMEQNGAYRHLYDSQMVLENYGKEGNA